MRFFIISTVLLIGFSLSTCKYLQPKPQKILSARQYSLDIAINDLAQMYKVDSYFREKFEKNRFSGSVLVAKEGKLLYKNAFGYADLDTKEPLSVKSSFQLASVSKPITAIGVMMLIDEGKISLDDEVKDFYPDFPYDGITVERLLAHRHGLSNYMYFSDRLWDRRDEGICNVEVIDLMIKNEPKPYYLPGKRYNYSNTGYALLAAIIEKASGLQYNDYMRANIFGPLCMSQTFVYDRCLNPEDKSLGVKGYRPNGREAEYSYLNGVLGDKNIYSSVEDLFKLDQALYDGSLVSEELLKKAYTPYHKELHLWDNYGFGWRLNVSKERTIVYHGGWWKGFKTYFIRVLPNKATIIVLTNRLKGGFLRRDELLALLDKK